MSTGTLIALVDGSKYSESVCHYAAWIAKRTDARVKIYHVLGRRLHGHLVHALVHQGIHQLVVRLVDGFSGIRVERLEDMGGGDKPVDPQFAKCTHQFHGRVQVRRPIVDTRQDVVVDIHKVLQLIDQVTLFFKKLEHACSLGQK